MRKCIVLFVILISSFLFTSRVYSQEASPAPEGEFNFEKAYKDYIFNQTVYEREHSEYLLARSQYLQAKTLATQTKARDETAQMLQARDDVLITYLTAIRMKLSETEGVADVVREGLFTRIDSEVSWFTNHKSRVSSAGTLKDLESDSNDAKTHFEGVTAGIAYVVLSTIAGGKVSVLRNFVNETLSLCKTKLVEIRQNGGVDTAIIDRWILETENKLTRAIEKEVEAQGKIAVFQNPKIKTGKSATYDEVIFKFQEAVEFLREANDFEREIVERMKISS